MDFKKIYQFDFFSMDLKKICQFLMMMMMMMIIIVIIIIVIIIVIIITIIIIFVDWKKITRFETFPGL